MIIDFPAPASVLALTIQQDPYVFPGKQAVGQQCQIASSEKPDHARTTVQFP